MRVAEENLDTTLTAQLLVSLDVIVAELQVAEAVLESRLLRERAQKLIDWLGDQRLESLRT